MKDIERLAEALKYLMRGWSENTNGGYAASGYVVSIRHEPLLAQLGYAALIKGSGDVSLGSNPNKAGTRPPGNAAPLNLLERISEEARAAHREGLELMGDVPSVVHTLRVRDVLHGLMGCCVQLQHQHPRYVVHAANLGDSWVGSARLLLGYDRRTVMLRDMVCHACGGALSVPVDASGDVVCVGVPTDDPERQQQPCGVTYPQWSWPDLLVQREAGPKLWTTREAVAYIVRERASMRTPTATRWLYNQAQEGKITNHGSPRKALWDSQEVLDQMAQFVGG